MQFYTLSLTRSGRLATLRTGTNLRAFRLLRVFRVSRIASRVKGVRVVLTMIRNYMGTLLALALIFFAHTFFFAVLGRELFAGRMPGTASCAVSVCSCLCMWVVCGVWCV